MIHRLISGLITAILALSAFTSASAEDSAKTLRILTYNIHHGEGNDRRLDLDRIAAIINDARVDIVALQEVDQSTRRSRGVDQAARLGELTGLQVAFGKAMDFQNGAYGVALLSRWPIHDVRVDALPAPAGTEPRVLLTARIQPSETAPAFRMSVTHVDHRADPTQRTAQIAKIRELLPASSASEPAVLAGDFNAPPDSAVIKGLLTEWADSAEGHAFLTIPADNPRRRIDYIFYRPSTRWRVIESRALDEAVASDHRPVLSVMELRP